MSNSDMTNPELLSLEGKINQRKFVLSVIGLGRVGLPLAIVFANKGVDVIGVENVESRLNQIRQFKCPFFDLKLQELLDSPIVRSHLSFETDIERATSKSQVIVITVGTPVNDNLSPDCTFLEKALNSIIKAGVIGKAIMLRSTAPAGFTLDYITYLRNQMRLNVGVDFAMATCPERILEGKAIEELHTLPEIVGVLDATSSRIASCLFKLIDERKRILITSPTSAELAKLYTNIYRYVRFALANEFAIWAENYGEDAQEIIRIANEDYPRGGIPLPGFAGGPCLGKDGFLLDRGVPFSGIISVAWKFNESIPLYVADAINRRFPTLRGLKMALLGYSFKAGSDDVRLSPSAKLRDVLEGYGAKVFVYDPHLSNFSDLDLVLTNASVVILSTNHSEFIGIENKVVASGCKLVYDVWGTLRAEEFPKNMYVRFGSGRDGEQFSGF